MSALRSEYARFGEWRRHFKKNAKHKSWGLQPMTELLDQSLLKISAALRGGQASCEELVSLAIARHSRAGARMNAYRAWEPDLALAEARAFDKARRAGSGFGPIGGLPVSVKDLYGVAGYPTYAGTARRLPSRWEHEGFLVRTIRAQQAIVMGKTHTVEMALGGLGNNPHWGTPRNPWSPAAHRVPGGSSAGAGVSLLEGSAVVALGTDTACSIRLPASMTGTVGHKITHGRWPVDGVVPLCPRLDVVGAVTRSVQDVAYFFSAVDPHHGDPQHFLATIGSAGLDRIRIGIGFTRVWDESQDDISSVVRDSLGELESHGARLVDVELPEFDAARDLYARGTIAPVECRTFLRDELPETLDGLHDTVGMRLRDAARVTADEYLLALHERRRLIDAAQNRFEFCDVLATPTVVMTPPTLSEIETLEDYLRLNGKTSWATVPVNMLDMCAITMPCGLDRSGMPVGLQLIAGNGEDEKLLAIALAVENVLGTPLSRIGRPGAPEDHTPLRKN